MPLVGKGLQNVFCRVSSEANVVFGAYGKKKQFKACRFGVFKFLKCVTAITAAEQRLSRVYFCVQ